jgi:hypothetical protein
MGETIVNGFSLKTVGEFGKLKYINEINKDGLTVWMNLLGFAKLFRQGIRNLQCSYRLKSLDDFLAPYFLSTIGTCSRFKALLLRVDT